MPTEFVINNIGGTIGSAQIKSSSKILLVVGDKNTFKLDNLKIDDGLLNIEASIEHFYNDYTLIKCYFI